jgi:hypothetical protein
LEEFQRAAFSGKPEGHRGNSTQAGRRYGLDTNLSQPRDTPVHIMPGSTRLLQDWRSRYKVPLPCAARVRAFRSRSHPTIRPGQNMRHQWKAAGLGKRPKRSSGRLDRQARKIDPRLQRRHQFFFHTAPDVLPFTGRSAHPSGRKCGFFVGEGTRPAGNPRCTNGDN